MKNTEKRPIKQPNRKTVSVETIRKRIQGNVQESHQTCDTDCL